MSQSTSHEGKQHIIIVGAGIIGVCTAYYLTRHSAFSPETHHITIIESKRVAGGASGKAGGLLALWAFPQQIVPLSFQLHQELSDMYNGEEEWGYRRLTTVSIEGDIASSGRKKSFSGLGSTSMLRQGSAGSGSFTGGLKNSLRVEEENKKAQAENRKPSADDLQSKDSLDITGGDTTRQGKDLSNDGSISSPVTMSSEEDFDKSLTDSSASSAEGRSEGDLSTVQSEKIDAAKDHEEKLNLPGDLDWVRPDVIDEWSLLGGSDSTAQVHPYKFTNFILKKAQETGAVDLVIGKVSHLNYNSDFTAAESVTYIPSSTKDEFTGASQSTVTLEGDQIVLTVGPWTSKILTDCPISGLRAHSITVATENNKTVSPYALFTELRISKNRYVSPEIYARKDEIYICGEGDTSVAVPDTTDDVEIVKEKCDELFGYVSKLSNQVSNGRILKRQACYLPVLDVPSSSGPLIGETNIENLYLASGHSCWGINNAPGTGMLLAELIFEGEAHSADISALDPSLYFDASVGPCE